MIKRSLRFTVSAIGLLGSVGVQAAETITYSYDALGRMTGSVAALPTSALQL
jgi:YD repeat-containing protein